MGLTEKQGGSDLRSVATRAEPVGAPGTGCAQALLCSPRATMPVISAFQAG
ncbi:acyl-CoA dehydrogenase [Bordetella pertussis]|nr:acyl-CoA dehydrogenase [Bordetella pertussis]